MSFNAIRENKILAKFSNLQYLGHWTPFERRLCTDDMFCVWFMLLIAVYSVLQISRLVAFSDVVWFYFSVSLPHGTVGWIVAFPRHTHLPSLCISPG